MRKDKAWHWEKAVGRGKKHLSHKKAVKSTVVMFPPELTGGH